MCCVLLNVWTWEAHIIAATMPLPLHPALRTHYCAKLTILTPGMRPLRLHSTLIYLFVVVANVVSCVDPPPSTHTHHHHHHHHPPHYIFPFDCDCRLLSHVTDVLMSLRSRQQGAVTRGRFKELLYKLMDSNMRMDMHQTEQAVQVNI